MRCSDASAFGSHSYAPSLMQLLLFLWEKDDAYNVHVASPCVSQVRVRTSGQLEVSLMGLDPNELFSVNHHDYNGTRNGVTSLFTDSFMGHNKRCNLRDNLDDAQRQGYTYSKVGEQSQSR
jgi:hypothetical protein